jgi:predicted NBD/HSP70 family sugar kinase
MLARQVDLPVWVDNDINAFALAEHLFGTAKSHDTVLTVGIGEGVGAALIAGNRLHHGANSVAGEIGHTIIVPEGRLCDCGRKGCLQTYWSEPALNSDWARRCESLKGAPQDLEKAAAAGHPEALGLLAAAGEGLGANLALLVDMVDPGIVVIVGEGGRFGEPLRGPLLKSLRERCFKSRPDVVFTWDHTSLPREAAALAVQRYFNFEIRRGMTALRVAG